MTAQNVAHPVITFQVNLELNRNEPIGPKTNSADVAMLHPDNHTSYVSEQQVPTKAARKDSRSALLGVNKQTSSAAPAYLAIPGVANGMNLKDGDQFTVSGLKAMEIRKNYVAGDWNNNVPEAGLGSVLTIVSSTLTPSA